MKPTKTCADCGDEFTGNCRVIKGERYCPDCEPLQGGSGGPTANPIPGVGASYSEAEAHRVQERRMRVIENGVNKGRKL